MEKRIRRTTMQLKRAAALVLTLAVVNVFGIFYSTKIEDVDAEKAPTLSVAGPQASIDYSQELTSMSDEDVWELPLNDIIHSTINQKIFESEVQANEDSPVEESAEINTEEESVLEEAISETDQVEPEPEPEPEIVYDSIVWTTADTDLAANRRISVDKMNAVIAKSASMCGGTPFEGNGDIFIEASEMSGLNPIYIFAHASWESGYGKSSQAVNKHNYFGIASFDSSPGSAYVMGDDMRAGIINGAIWIADNYYNQGQTTLNQMIYGRKQYASSGESWISGILSIMNRYLD